MNENRTLLYWPSAPPRTQQNVLASKCKSNDGSNKLIENENTHSSDMRSWFLLFGKLNFPEFLISTAPDIYFFLRKEFAILSFPRWNCSSGFDCSARFSKTAFYNIVQGRSANPIRRGRFAKSPIPRNQIISHVILWYWISLGAENIRPARCVQRFLGAKKERIIANGIPSRYVL